MLERTIASMISPPVVFAVALMVLCDQRSNTVQQRVLRAERASVLEMVWDTADAASATSACFLDGAAATKANPAVSRIAQSLLWHAERTASIWFVSRILSNR